MSTVTMPFHHSSQSVSKMLLDSNGTKSRQKSIYDMILDITVSWMHVSHRSDSHHSLYDLMSTMSSLPALIHGYASFAMYGVIKAAMFLWYISTTSSFSSYDIFPKEPVRNSENDTIKIFLIKKINQDIHAYHTSLRLQPDTGYPKFSIITGSVL